MKSRRAAKHGLTDPSLADDQTRPRRRGAGPWALVFLYLALILIPLGLASLLPD